MPSRRPYPCLASAVVLLAISPACKSPGAGAPRHWTLCTCDYMTDRDQPGKVNVEVCGDGTRLTDVARSCALNSGVGAVIGCACQAGAGEPCRDRDICRDVDTAPP